MPPKGYKERVKLGLQRLKEDPEIQDPLFDSHSAAADVGEIFQLVAGPGLFARLSTTAAASWCSGRADAYSRVHRDWAPILITRRLTASPPSHLVG
jgi:hypothetical protein